MKNVIIVVLFLFVFLAGCSTKVASPVNEPTPLAPPVVATPPPVINVLPSEAKAYVEIVNFAFSPAAITIKKGTTVIWTNKDSAKHTVTSVSGTELNSQVLATGQSYSHIFTEAGTYAYLCTIHPMMKGTVIVE